MQTGQKADHEEYLSEEGLVILYRENARAIHAYIYTIVKNADDAKDILQSTFCNIFESITRKSLKIRNSRAYAYKTARNLALNKIQRYKNEDSSAEIQINLFRHTHELDRNESKLLINDIIDYAKGNFAENEFEIFMLRSVYELTLEEIASIAGISIGSIHSMLKNLRDKIVQKFGGLE